jgi:hypothetical protein
MKTTRFRTVPRRPLAVVLLVVPLGVTACSSQSGAPSIGMQRASVDLSFTDKSIAVAPPAVALPPTLAQAITQAPAGTVPAQVGYLTPFSVPPPGGQAPVCPALSPYEVHASKPVTTGITTPLTAGKYPVVNKGRIVSALAATGLSSTAAYPVVTSMQISHVNEQLTPANPGTSAGGQTIGAAAAAETGTFEVKDDNGNGNYTLSYYQLTPGELDLVKRVTYINKTTLTFTPTPALKILGLGAVGTSWNSAAADPSTGAIGIVQGSINGIQTVDVCGTPVNAYVIKSSERYLSISPSGTVYESVTNDNYNDPNNPTAAAGQANYYRVATELGGLFVSTDTHTTTTLPPYTITINNTATLSSVKPKR